MPKASLEFVINHVFLPPKLPQEDDWAASHDHALIGSLRDSSLEFIKVQPDSTTSLAPAIGMLERLLETYSTGVLKKNALSKALSDLKEGDSSLFHLCAQNAGLLLTARKDDVLIEAFELLAPNQNVMSCSGALLRSFPDRAVTVCRKKLDKRDLKLELVDVLYRLKLETAPAARPKTKKGGTLQPEERDTNSPFLVTGMLVDVLVGLGQEVDPDRITKRSREQVGWDNALKPFRRSDAWLLLRVAFRLVLDRQQTSPGNEQKSWYKPLMAFHHARLLQLATGVTQHDSIKRDTLYCMMAKVVRRITKLNPLEETCWVKEVRRIVVLAKAGLQKRWQSAQDNDWKILPLQKFARVSFSEDANLQLTKLCRHLSWIKSRPTSHRDTLGPGDVTRFEPLQPQAANFPSPSLIESGDMTMARSRLLNFEAWVEFMPARQKTLDATKAIDPEDASVHQVVSNLQALIMAYHETASTVYTETPEAQSVMYLVIMELWLALDKVAGKAIPLLLDFDPGFPPGLLCPLLLEKGQQMRRLKRVEDYLRQRKASAANSYPSAFANFGGCESFAVRWYNDLDRSSKHYDLRAEIEALASRMKTEKLDEFNNMRAKYDTLVASRNATPEHTYTWDDRFHADNHFTHLCKRCQLDKQIDALYINIFEWPLPTDSNHAKAAVFEISVPQLVKTWRDVTFSLVADVFRDRKYQKKGDGEKLYFAGASTCLQRFTSLFSRLRPASTIKPMEVAHYRRKHIRDATREDICVTHCAQYEYYDESKRVRSWEAVSGPCIPPQCSLAEMSQDTTIEKWIRSTTHTSNHVIASQSLCALDMTLEDFRAFGHLRSGVTLQWANILCQLHIPSINLNKRATFILVMQACLEAEDPGPATVDSVFRRAHDDTQKREFMVSMIEGLRAALERVRESWQNDIAACLLVCLATRLLYLSPSTQISSSLLDYLSELRRLSINWAWLMLEKLNNCSKDHDRGDWTQRVLMTALVCGCTFNMDTKHLGAVLSDAQNLSFLVESAILVRNHLPASGKPSDPVALQLVHRWHSVLYQAGPVVSKEVCRRKNTGLDDAIKQFWAGYSRVSSGWSVGPRGQTHILKSSSASFSATLNLLTGSLFVNGYPLSKLPMEYQSHDTFKELFGDQIVDVGPSSAPGMQFSACRPQDGWVIHFAMQDRRLIIHAERPITSSGCDSSGPEKEVCEYIPRRCLADDVPASFVEKYSHWLSRSPGVQVVEFRPMNKKWVTSPYNWRMTREGDQAKLSKGDLYVLDPFKESAKSVYRVMDAIESRSNINLIFDINSRILAIDLPRLSLSFTVKEGESKVLSKNYTGMQIDKVQGIETLIGLSNKLVLCPEEEFSLSSSRFRMVLVPRGEISASQTKNPHHDHVEITVKDDDSSVSAQIRHDAFTVDHNLGRLTDNGSLQSKLNLCLLHALTSHALPDPLTGRTGTEQALDMLSSAAVRSYGRLDSDACEILSRIANLSPWREYYPRHLQLMETTKRHYRIPPLSHHEFFASIAKSIYEQYQSSDALFGTTSESSSSAKNLSVLQRTGSPILDKRARIRNSVFRVSDFGAEEHYTDHDQWYRPEDRKMVGCSPTSRGKRVSDLVRCIESDRGRLVQKPASDLAARILSVNGDKFSGDETISLEFDLDNLKSPEKVLAGLWCGLHGGLAGEENRYRKIFFLATLLYADNANWEVVQALMALGTIATFGRAVLPPPDSDLNGSVFNLEINKRTLPGIWKDQAHNATHPFHKCPEKDLAKGGRESNSQAKTRRYNLWKSNSVDKVGQFVGELSTQLYKGWTVTTPDGNSLYSTYIDVSTVMSTVPTQVDLARRSEEFTTYLDEIVRILDHLPTMARQDAMMCKSPSLEAPPSKPGFVSAMSLFSAPAPTSERPRPDPLPTLRAEVSGQRQNHETLSKLVDDLSSANNLQPHQVSYIDRLRLSLASQPQTPLLHHGAVSRDVPLVQALVTIHLQEQRERYHSIHQNIISALSGSSVAHQFCQKAGLYPRCSAAFLFQRLTRIFWGQLSGEWQAALVNHALAFIYLQRAERLAGYCRDLPRRWTDLQRELANPGDHGSPDWDPLRHPESMLFELEQNILIRPVQNSIAAVMRDPPDMKNSVMQLNMGEGKSSVIVPIVAAALADGSRLVRVVVAKPQSNQMMHMLIGKLGGLINRRIFYLPFSRSVQLSMTQVKAVRGMLDACKDEGGILLVQPEQLLSFKLMGIDKTFVTDGETKDSLGSAIVRLHQDFEMVSRDIVDESDENFSVKFELIYTMGTQEAVEMSPDRWILIQQLLKMVEEIARQLKGAENEPDVSEGLLLENHEQGRVPVIRILGEPAGRRLVKALADRVCTQGLKGFPVHHQPTKMRRAVLSYISHDNPDAADVALVESVDSGVFSELPIRNSLLLLRGLLAKGVILFALSQKRFRVNYGLAPGRQPPTSLAVPYRAKDIPSPRSEFSHPDVVIVLTCLSYYYRGLSDAELDVCLELLSKSEQADQEYGRWAISAPTLPPSFQHFSSINPKDRPQCENTVFPALRYAKPAVDFYLAQVVFPKEMKQFPLKLSASGWDLAKPKAHPLTGFSGTNDSKDVLPLSVTPLDLPEQLHTNAAVLSCLLREENKVVELGKEQHQLSALTEKMLLDAVITSDPPIKVILDVGAQIIESSNIQIAQKWLSLVPATEADAVVFFNDSDELSVVTRSGAIDPFLTSPFVTHTDRCLVFLDQAHTRGTDLKLPDSYRAAVTLGPGVTKDTLVQACMRMRKLGQGQSVTFCASPEMQTRIRTIRKAADAPDLLQPLTVSDVLTWAIGETWDEAVRSVPLWAAQGMRHLGQEAIWDRQIKSGKFTKTDAQDYLEPEAMSLEQRYRPNATTTAVVSALLSSLITPDNTRQDQGTRIREKLQSFAVASSSSSSSATNLQEEQERELAPEVEAERQTERPAPRKALLHRLHPDVVSFARTGIIPVGSKAFHSAFTALVKTSAVSLYGPGISKFPSDLLVTSDFARSVDESGIFCGNAYQKEVHWVLCCDDARPEETNCGMRMVVVSQWEANQLKEELASSSIGGKVSLHAYMPRLGLTSSQAMEDLKAYTVPPVGKGWAAPEQLVMQLNLFAGQLYLRDYGEYVRLCRYLGLAYMENKGEEVVAPDGFVGRRGYRDCKFEVSPIPFLTEVYKKIRRDCVSIEKTHMGRILSGEILTEADF
ncbi:hypothetical protein B0H66DRAFT_515810 [Apodospora peruviana]|uniref:ubiquitinyl hydrolase 1 n=1 Tax=Apodospora peruviana TaxID=516989 RepID=A0AAE0IDQ6_9PEZI|nr:hypothetical protein B0H66DRAFT_515810 [Apodospora peruviana]